MKKVLLLFMTLATLALSAQNMDSNKRGSKTDYTPEQRAELRTKQMTLELDLSESQQAKVKQLFLTTNPNRSTSNKKRSEMTSDEKFEFKNAMLDRRIAMKKELTKILNEEQLKKWENSENRHKRHFKNKRQINKGDDE